MCLVFMPKLKVLKNDASKFEINSKAGDIGHGRAAVFNPEFGLC